MNSLSIQYIFSRMHYEFTICFANTSDCSLFLVYSLSVSHIHLEATISRNHCEFTICLAVLVEIHFREITMDLLFTICFANWLWIKYLFGELTMNSLSVSLTLHLLPRISIEINIFCKIFLGFLYLLQSTSLFYHGRSPTPTLKTLEKSYKKVYLYRNPWQKVSMNSLSRSRIPHEFTKSLSIHYFFEHYFAMNPLSYSPIHYVSREFTINAVSVTIF